MNIANGKKNEELQKWKMSVKRHLEMICQEETGGTEQKYHSTNAKKLIPKKGIWVSLTGVIHNSRSHSFPAIVLTYMVPPQLIRTLNKITPGKVGGSTCGVLCLSIHLQGGVSIGPCDGQQVCQSSLFSQNKIFSSISMIQEYRADYIRINSNWKLTVFVTLSSCT